MNANIIGTIVYAYKHKDYGDVFLCLESLPYSDWQCFQITDKAYVAINSYHEYIHEFDKMIRDSQEDYVYMKICKDYTDEEGYTGQLEKIISFQIKDFVKVAFESDFRKVVND